MASGLLVDVVQHPQLRSTLGDGKKELLGCDVDLPFCERLGERTCLGWVNDVTWNGSAMGCPALESNARPHTLSNPLRFETK
jgi:hypothetical protein